jgi:hypothetical protein
MCSSYHRQAARFLTNLHSLVESSHIGEPNFMHTVEIMFCCGRSITHSQISSQLKNLSIDNNVIIWSAEMLAP